MPRPKAVGKWDLKITPDEYYSKPDPFSVIFSWEECGKVSLICGLIDKFYDEDVAILDIGCGEGHATPPNSTGIDISTVAIGRARINYPNRKSKFYVHDITKGSYGSDWDVIIFSEVLYYIKPELWKTVVKNILNVLDIKGQLIVSVGQYFTENDIKGIFKKIKFDKIYKIPNKKYGYWLIMSGHRV